MLCILKLGAFLNFVHFPLHIWLPDRMVAPTSYDDLFTIMVKAGIYLVVILHTVFVIKWALGTVGSRVLYCDNIILVLLICQNKLILIVVLAFWTVSHSF